MSAVTIKDVSPNGRTIYAVWSANYVEPFPRPNLWVGPNKSLPLTLPDSFFIYLYRDADAVSPGQLPFWVAKVKGDSELEVDLDATPVQVKLNKSTIGVRPNQNTLTAAQQQAYVSAIIALNVPPPRISPAKGSVFGLLVAIHGVHAYDMHGFMGPYGTQRFLAWHRIYLLQFEQALQTVDPSVRIPYWDWSADRAIPLWISKFTPSVVIPGRSDNPTNVVRNAGDAKDLPTPQRITDVMANTNFTDFTSVVPAGTDGPEGGLEGVHNGVHDWFPNSTMNNLGRAPADPIFWMHHANIDRIWARWQYANPSQFPNLPLNTLNTDAEVPAGTQVSSMTPWTQFTEANTRDTVGLGYTYI
jgi:tyrosinase